MYQLSFVGQGVWGGKNTLLRNLAMQTKPPVRKRASVGVANIVWGDGVLILGELLLLAYAASTLQSYAGICSVVYHNLSS